MFFLTTLLAVATARAASPIEIEQGKQYTAGQRIGVSALGVSLEVPSGWKAGVPPGAEALLIASDTEPGMVLVSADAVPSVQDLAAQLSQPIPVDWSLILQPAGQPTVQGQTVSNTYQATDPQGTALVGHAIGIVNEGRGVALIAAGPATHSEQLKALVGQVHKSVAFAAKPKPGEVTPATGPFAKELRGKMLLYLKTANGFSDEKKLWLCSNGTVLSSNNSSGMSMGGGATATYASQGKGHGTWTTAGNTLTIIWNDGGTSTYGLSREGTRIRIDQSKNWWVQPNDRCQ